VKEIISKQKETLKLCEDNWHQAIAIHCPDHNCSGMLLQSDFRHEMKCSKCGKLWIEISRWEEVKDE